ncbi:MAG TPA: hypothetical protein VGX96_04465 [Candidatus Elarobacter sp.]|nr:hypothetical protein [Candidatus Elarobacter sp.]
MTTVFEHEAAVQRAALGMDGLTPVVVTHPLSTLTAEQLDARAREAAPQVLAVWQGTENH